MKSIGQMISQLEALVGTDDVTEWERDFIMSVCNRTDSGKNTTSLSEKQVDVVTRIYKKHFGDAE